MRKLALAGFGIWLGASIALRLLGQFLLDPSAAGRVVALLVVSAPVMFYLPRRLFRVFAIDRAAFGRGAAALVVPGMVLDALATIWFPIAYPNMRPDVAGLFGGWLLFCNALALVGAATFGEPAARSAHHE
jgi:Family of unknown function (DUF5367)